MTVKQLKEKIQNLPDTMEVFMDERLTDEFKYGLVNSAKVLKILFYDSGDSTNEDVQAYDEVLILSEE